MTEPEIINEFAKGEGLQRRIVRGPHPMLQDSDEIHLYIEDKTAAGWQYSEHLGKCLDESGAPDNQELNVDDYVDLGEEIDNTLSVGNVDLNKLYELYEQHDGTIVVDITTYDVIASGTDGYTLGSELAEKEFNPDDVVFINTSQPFPPQERDLNG